MEVTGIFFDKLVELKERAEVTSVLEARQEFFKKMDDEYDGSIPNAPELNSLIWLEDVISIFFECRFAVAWISALRKYKGEVTLWEEIDDFHLNYYFGDVATRLLSSRDKLYIALLSYFLPIDPRDMLPDYKEKNVRARILEVKAIAHHSERTESAVLTERILLALFNESWKKIKDYRNKKVHRREPRVYLKKIEPLKLRYMIPVLREKDIEEAEKHFRFRLDEKAKADLGVDFLPLGSPEIDGVTYLMKSTESIWDFDELFQHVEECYGNLSSGIAEWLMHLTEQFPFGREF